MVCHGDLTVRSIIVWFSVSMSTILFVKVFFKKRYLIRHFLSSYYDQEASSFSVGVSGAEVMTHGYHRLHIPFNWPLDSYILPQTNQVSFFIFSLQRTLARSLTHIAGETFKPSEREIMYLCPQRVQIASMALRFGSGSAAKQLTMAPSTCG